MDEKTKIHILLNGIQEPVLAPVKTIIHTTPALCNNFKEDVGALAAAVQEAATKVHQLVQHIFYGTN